ncbi:uncharacterized protein LOC141827231 [Curcuma longa]|uniref:uncharacterized protein LOC141827231 n=1 Tax=Curcuma longa TaxID=136217 RepID=UPI003D9DBCCF
MVNERATPDRLEASVPMEDTMRALIDLLIKPLLPATIMSSSPILTLLNEKLASENFIKWKSNINIALVCENLKFVLTEECPSEPPLNAARSVREIYDKWVAANNKAKGYMLAGMSDALRLKHEHVENAYQIMDSLQAMFGQQSSQSKHEAIKNAMNATMKKGQSVGAHILNMVNYFTEVATHGATIDDGTQLLNELQTFEAISIGKVQED